MKKLKSKPLSEFPMTVVDVKLQYEMVRLKNDRYSIHADHRGNYLVYDNASYNSENHKIFSTISGATHYLRTLLNINKIQIIKQK